MMKKLYLNDFVYIAFLISFLCFGFSMALSYITSAVAFVIAFVSMFRSKEQLFTKKKIVYFVCIILPFILAVLSLSYSENITKNLYSIEKLSFFVLTVFSLLFLDNRNKFNLKTVLLGFAYMTVLLYLSSIVNGIIYYFKTGFLFEYKYSNSFLEIQHNYLSIYGVFSSFIFLVDMIEKKKKWTYFLNSFFIFLIVGFIILLSSRFAIILIFTLILSYVIFSLFNKKNRKNALIVLLLGSFAAIFLIFSTNTLQRFEKLKVEDRSPRYSIWRCTLDIIDKNATIFSGVGSGNAQEKIDNCLVASKRKYWVGLHSHNQILGYVLDFGYLPAAIIIFVFLHFLYKSIKFKNYNFFVFLIIILTFGLVENYMRRRYGVFFYGFFISLFVKEILTQHALINEH